jgi:hypothetical protein
MVAEMVCLGRVDCKVLGFRAEVLQQTPFESDATMVATPPSPKRLSLLPPEDEEIVQQAMEEFAPLETPHFEILLDQRPPLIRPALNADGEPARPAVELPFTLHAGQYGRLLLAPVTHRPELTVWSLYVVWEFKGRRQESLYGEFQVTGYTGWMTFVPHGEPSPTPVSQVAYDHWDLQYTVDG